MAKLEGIDVSHWNNDLTIPEQKPDFVIIKATEGATYKDPKMNYHYYLADELGYLTGFYHYARAEKNTPQIEAKWFLENIPKDAIGRSILALDVEGKSLSLSSMALDEWAFQFLETVRIVTGVKPLLYISQGITIRFPKTASCGYGLWVARYRNRMLGYGDVKPWKFAAIWQYTSKPHDKDVFYGNREQFKKYARVGEKGGINNGLH